MPKETTTKMKVDISELTAQFQNAKKQIALVNSEFKAATAGMGKWTDSADGVSAKITQLTKVLDAEESKLDSLEKQYKLVVAEQGKNSKSAQDLAIKINNQRATVEKTKSSLEGYESKLDDMKKSAAAASTATSKLTSKISDQESELDQLKRAYSDAVLEQGKNSKQAKSLATDIDKLSTSLQKNKADLSKAETAADRFDRSLDKVQDGSEKATGGFTIMKGALASLLADGIKTVVTGLANLASSTQEYREDMGKLETAWESAGKSTKLATDTYKEFYSVLGEEDRSVEAVNHLAKFVDTEKDMTKWTDIAAGVWGTFGDSLPIEGLTEAANETAKVGKVTGPLADALNWAGVSEDKFNKSLEKCNSEQERAQLITDTLNGLYSTAADKYRENNASVIDARKANSDYTDSMAELGARVEPITTKVREGFNKILQKILELTSGVDMESFGAMIDTAFDGFINTIIPAIVNGLTWIKDNKDVIIAGIAGIGAAFAAFKVVSLIQGITAALRGMSAATVLAAAKQWLLNIAMNANPIGLIIAAIVGLITAFVVLWKKSDAFRNFWIGLWEKIKEVALVVWEAIKGFFASAWDWIKSVWEKAKPFFLAIWKAIKAIFSVVKKVLGAYFSAAWEYIKVIWGVVVSYFKTIWENIKLIFSVVKKVLSGDFKGAWEAIKKIFANTGKFFSGVWDSIKKVFSIVDTFFGRVFGKAWDAVKKAFSKVGDFFGGIWDTIKEKFSSIGTKVGETIGGAFKTAINAVIATVEKGINFIPNAINKAIGKINELPGVNIGRMSTISLPRLERGGILKRGQVGLLEGKGDEAVIPLERNRGWIKNIASEMLSQLKGSGTSFGQTSLNPIQNVTNNFYQYNNSPKALSRLEIYRQTKNQLNFAKGG